MGELLDWILRNEDSFRQSRLPSLYSDLNLQRQTNPAGYTFNVAAWQAALSHAALAGQVGGPTSSYPPRSDVANTTTASTSSSSILTLQPSDSLLDALSSSRYGRPLGLGAVIDDSVRNGKMIPAPDFLRMQRSVNQPTGWVPSPWTVLEWGLKSLGVMGDARWDVGGGRSRVRDKLVILENVEHVAREAVKRQEEKYGLGSTDRVWSREAFVRELAAANDSAAYLDREDVEVLLKFLERDKQAISYDDKVVKFKAPSADRPEPITHQDATIASLKTLISTLTSQSDALSNRISTLAANATTAMKSSNRISALSALRSKKLAERNLKQRTDTLSQLDEFYAKIEQAADQVEIVKVMEASAGVLKGLNKEVGGVNKVEDVIEGLKEEMSKVDDVGQVIQEPIGAREQIDEGEIDNELEAMEAEEKEKGMLAEREREEREAEATRRKLEEIAKKEDLENIEERTQLMTPADAGKQHDDSKKRQPIRVSEIHGRRDGRLDETSRAEENQATSAEMV